MPKYYSNKEYILRATWSLIEIIFFRYTPRLFYGWRNLILRIMGAKIGKGVKIYPSARIMYPWLLQIGDNTTISWDVKVYNLSFSSIGNNTMISQYAHLCGGTHDFRSKGFDLIRTGFTIGNHVWVAADAFIGPAVNVGDGAVVAARAVVVKDVLPGSIVAGNPARSIGNV
jgi:putative colanic acid biosynthesis acetyltransferase WcaF